MNTSQIRSSFLDFFKSKGCTIIPSASLIPENDPTVLFNTAGMQPLVPYLLGENHPMGTRIANVQKCVRTTDIEEVGDSSHLTMLEMLGHWSFGDYYKKEALEWIWEWFTGVNYLNLDPKRLYITVYEGDKDIPPDEESINIWKNIFKQANIPFIEGKRWARLGRSDNWWEIAGSNNSPAGPDSEIFYYLGQEDNPSFDSESSDFIEISNSVFMSYQKDHGSYKELASKNVDFGGGLERLAMVKQGANSVYQTDNFVEIIKAIASISPSNYDQNNQPAYHIIADHYRSAIFMAGDGIEPSNIGRGYVMRRLLRRAIGRGKELNIDSSLALTLVPVITHLYKDQYSELDNSDKIINILTKEEMLFDLTLSKGLRELKKMLNRGESLITGSIAFKLFDTYGFPLDLTKEQALLLNIKLSSDLDQVFNDLMLKQRQRSQSFSKGAFKGGLADDSEMSTRYHSATHLMYQALRQVLGDHVMQRGSNITSERMRFDFSHHQKVSIAEIGQIEQIVNNIIKQDLPISYQEMPKEEAFKKGALGAFGEKYADIVKVYTVGTDGDYFSREICGGPHVEHTGIIGNFKIIKEESSSSGVRRIKAVLT